MAQFFGFSFVCLLQTQTSPRAVIFDHRNVITIAMKTLRKVNGAPDSGNATTHKRMRDKVALAAGPEMVVPAGWANIGETHGLGRSSARVGDHQ